MLSWFSVNEVWVRCVVYLLAYGGWVCGLGVVLYSLWYCVALGGFGVLGLVCLIWFFCVC